MTKYPHLLDTCRVLTMDAQVFFPTGHPKPAPTGSGLPDRFDRLLVETGQIQIWIQMVSFNRFVPVYRPVWLVTCQIQKKKNLV